MTAMVRIITLCAVTALLLAACGSSPQVRYFSLAPTTNGNQGDPEDSVVLGMGPIVMPEYLNRSQMVTRGAGTELMIDEFNRWAEPLKVSFHRVLSTDVDLLLDGVKVVAFPYDSLIRTHVDYRLVGNVLRFDADGSGRIVLEAQWAVTDTENGVIVSGRRSRYDTRASSAADPGSIAEAMNQALSKFSRDIAGKLEAALQE